MWTFNDVLEFIKAIGPFGAIVFGLHSVNKTLKGNYLNSVNVEKEKMKYERNSIATLLIAELDTAQKYIQYYRSVGPGKINNIYEEHFQNLDVFFKLVMPKMGIMSLDTVQTVSRAYSILERTISFCIAEAAISQKSHAVNIPSLNKDFFTNATLIHETLKPKEYIINDYIQFSKTMKYIEEAIEDAIKKLESEIK